MARKRANEVKHDGTLTDLSTMSIKEEYGRRIAFYRKRKNMLQLQLAEILGVGSNSVSLWESGKTMPDIINIAPLCRALDITASQLIGDGLGKNTKECDLLNDYRHMSPGHQHSVRQLAKSLRAMDEPAVECPDLVVVPKAFRPLAAGIGDPTEVFEENELMYLHANQRTKRANYIFTVNGDSMEPDYPDGCLVMVGKCSIRDMANGMVGAFSIGNETYIKTLQDDGLHSINPKYKTITFEANPNTMLIGNIIGIVSPEDIATKDEVQLFMELSKD